MPSNLYGPNDSYDLENSHVLPALISKIHKAKLDKNKELKRIEEIEKNKRLEKFSRIYFNKVKMNYQINEK